MTKLSAPGHPFQYAWHVPDLDKAIDHWTNHDLIPKDRVGFHHIGIWSDDYFADKSLLTERYENVMDMGPNSNICYFDTSADSGNMLELIERNDGITGLFDKITKAAEGWDGTKPSRTMAELMGG